jgi:glutathione peroxidase
MDFTLHQGVGWNRQIQGLTQSRQASEVIAMRAIAGLILLFFGVSIMDSELLAAGGAAAESQSPVLNRDMKTLGGEDVNLADKYAGKVVLLVNVASKCGNTPQYAALEALHEKYDDQGLAIVGVPCNQFGGQEPGTADEIQQFCKQNYGVEFDMLGKVDVNGENACPLYKYLTSAETDPEFAGKITWNFEKFLINRQGQVVARFAPKVKPDAPEVTLAIETELAKP